MLGPGRNPSENCCLLRDVVMDANKNNIGGAVPSLDQEKVFDRIKWSYLQRVLQQMNFGESFRQWVSLLNCDIFSSVLINGEPSQQFRVSCSCTKGVPCRACYTW